ncbi:hypothetical protein MPER_13074 [Moniliophthora perniciosa FA553]|nr:hypothetical protein MPER_13074 [Moniliophthora perniciosa FA553]
MSTGSNYTTIQVLPDEQKLNGENYYSWKDIMLLTGRVKGLDLYWEGKVTIPPPTITVSPPGTTSTDSTQGKTTTVTAVNDPNPSYLEYTLRESVALLTLWNNIKNPVGLGLSASNRNSRELWSYLKTEFSMVSNLARQRKEDNLRSQRYTEGPITGEGGYAEKMRTLRREASDSGATITDATFITIFLDSFPRNAEWSIVTGNLMSEKSFTIIANRLHEYWIHRTGGDGTTRVPEKDKISALQAEIESLKALVAERKQRAKKKSDVTCTNPNCKSKEGHSIDNCWALGGGKQGQYPPWFQGKRTAPIPSANAATTASTSSAGTVTQGKVYALATETIHAMTTPPSTKTVRTLGDCAASYHFFNSREYFKNYRKYDDALLGNSSKEGVQFEILGVGDVELRVYHNDVAHTLILRDALYAPTIACNLVALGLLDKKGWKMVLGGGKILFHDPVGTPVFEAALGESNLYTINGAFTVPNPPVAFAVPSIDLWHRRSAHIAKERIKNAQTLLDGLDIADLPLGNEHRCEPCILANHRKSPYPPSTENTTTPLYLLGVDIWGPSRVPSVGGNRYAMVLVDAGTAMKFCEPLPDRTAERTLKVLDDLKRLGENQTGQKLKRVRTDNAAEFQSKLWEEYFVSHGIIHEFTTAYSSSSNGMAERSIGVVIGSARTLLVESKLGARWWAEAVAAAVYTGNLFPSSRHPDTIPAEAWTGKRQSVAHLRPFGCTAYVLIPAESGRSKLDERSIKCQLIGYDSPGIYKCKVVGSDEVVRSRHIIFHEGDGQWVSEVEGETEEDYSLLDVDDSATSDGPTSPDSLNSTPSEQPLSPNPLSPNPPISQSST